MVSMPVSTIVMVHGSDSLRWISSLFRFRSTVMSEVCMK